MHVETQSQKLWKAKGTPQKKKKKGRRGTLGHRGVKNTTRTLFTESSKQGSKGLTEAEQKIRETVCSLS